MNRRSLFAVAMAALALSFCKLGDKTRQKVGESLAEKAIEKSTGKKVDIQQDGQKITVTDGTGQSALMVGNALPDGFPTDVPLYPGATPQGGFGATAPEGAMTIANLKAADAPPKLMEWYVKELPAQGWKVQSQVASGPDGGMLLAEKADRALTVTIGKDEAGSSFVLMIGKKQP